jgi:regulatory protein
MPPKSTPDPATLRERALGYLARREHSRFELSRKLEVAGFAPEAIARVLNDFETKNWLSDQRFAESYVADHRARAGCVKLAHDLRQRGVPETIIESLLCEDRGSEAQRAREVWQKKFGIVPTHAADKARQIRFLQSRGFTPEAIRHAIRREDGRDERDQ